MRLAETVTFGGSGFDRAAELRGDAVTQAALLADPAARALPVWRGKPLLAGEAALGWVAPDHAVFAEAHDAPIFLGRDADGPRFARDISRWEPAEVDEDQLRAFFDPSVQRHPALPEAWCFAELRSAMARLDARDAELAATARALFMWHRSHRFCSRCGARSEPAQAGWQRHCPSCGGQHFPRTDPVVIMLVTHGNSVLLGRSHHWPERMYSLLAGFMEPGETIEAAVRREVAEETRIEVGPVDYLACQPWPYPSSLMIGCHGRALSREITVDETELQDARWVGREELAACFAGAHPDISPAREGAIAHFLLHNWLADRLD
ncbi:NAD(+) diphosphatase [Maritimibacter sp. 55A14]|uniref:NAD(+) diphosphatase n=1 Tax=Maritimibacter sp. 55A14 TaxID=2174844 RepID=UPI000D61868D|nr:NAD(+) diphosphatase [Maritimibacter sp. 55A14]PWE32280.1 NAD(+) diphosphatase [Maritimibacter sp. 55A14]